MTMGFYLYWLVSGNVPWDIYIYLYELDMNTWYVDLK